jgi:uncharacterized low-complexity protein
LWIKSNSGREVREGKCGKGSAGREVWEGKCGKGSVGRDKRVKIGCSDDLEDRYHARFRECDRL